MPCLLAYATVLCSLANKQIVRQLQNRLRMCRLDMHRLDIL
jgi:hypothetical protein